MGYEIIIAISFELFRLLPIAFYTIKKRSGSWFWMGVTLINVRHQVVKQPKIGGLRKALILPKIRLRQYLESSYLQKCVELLQSSLIHPICFMAWLFWLN